MFGSQTLRQSLQTMPSGYFHLPVITNRQDLTHHDYSTCYSTSVTHLPLPAGLHHMHNIKLLFCALWRSTDNTPHVAELNMCRRKEQ